MVSLGEYLRDPCGTSSLPYWKAIGTPVPDGMSVVHDRDFSAGFLLTYADEPYFRLKCDMRNVTEPRLDVRFVARTATPDDFAALASLINTCYDDVAVTEKQVLGWTLTGVYRRDLWLLVTEKETSALIGAGIADYDPETRELILEWIQVLPAYRRMGIGRYIVQALLAKTKGVATFATVSGRKDSPHDVEALYRECGFEGNDVWHVLRKK